jgi:hypothetical protein
MPMPEPLSQNASSPFKRALVDAGFEIFRTRGDEIVLAERPRENLIMDSGVRLRVSEPLEVRVILRAQKADFPSDDDLTLFDRVRKLGIATLATGFAEINATMTRVADPGDAERTLDTFYEITYAKAAGVLAEAILEIQAALRIEKRV